MPAPIDALMGGGMPGMATPGMDQNPMAGQAMSAMDSLMPKSPNPTAAVQQAEQTLGEIHKLVMGLIPTISQWNQKLAKELHSIAKSVVAAQMDLKKENQGPMGMPPMMGMSPEAMGMPPAGPSLGAPVS